MCIDGINGYTCVCPAGYTGVNCETSKNKVESRKQKGLLQDNSICELWENTMLFALNFQFIIDNFNDDLVHNIFQD